MSRPHRMFVLLPLGAALALRLVQASGRHSTGPLVVQSGTPSYLPVAIHATDLRSVPPAATVDPPSPTVGRTATPEPAGTPTVTPPAKPTDGPTACGQIPTFDHGLAPTGEVHVSATGSDQTGDGSPANPYASIRRAARDASPGTAVRVHAGTYPGSVYVEGLAGTAVAPIWIGGVPGEVRPVLEGGGEGMHLSRVAYVVVHDLEVRGARNNGINADDGGAYDDPDAAHHVLFSDIYIHDIGGTGNQDCLKLSGVNHFFVLDSEFARCGGSQSGSGIDHVGCHHGLIARNRFEDLSANAVQAKGGSSDIEIRWNRMRGAGERAVNMGGSTGFEYFRPPLSRTSPNAEARDIRVVANVIEGGTAPLAFVGCVDCLAANNTVVDPERWLLRILQETTTSGGFAFEPVGDGRFVNNLVFFSRGRIRTHVNIGPNTEPGTFAFAHNLWYAHDDPGRSQPDLPAAEVGAVVGRDPAFASGYSIDTSSPAARAGTHVAGVRGDITGSCYGDPPSIGAFGVPAPESRATQPAEPPAAALR